jgi:acyl-CoA thioester hydrolase
VLPSGRDGFRFCTDVTVRFSETDAQGVAHNAVYLVWFEIARVDYLGRFDGGYPALRAQGVEATTTESHVRYRAPARFADQLRVHTCCRDIRGARFRFEYVIERVHPSPTESPEGSARAAVLVAEGWTSHACVDARTLRPTRMPAWLADAISAAESTDELSRARGSRGPAAPGSRR